MIVLNDKAAQFDWERFRENTRKSTPVDLNESFEEKKKRIAALEADPQKWKQYYFPKYYKYPSPKFHIKASNRLLKKFIEKRHWYEVRHWARGLAKSTTTMFDVLFLVMTGKLHNILLTSSTKDAATAFLTKYQVQLDSNQRLINDYGKQERPGSWTQGEFTTRGGVSFLSVGAGNTPRGQGNEEFRPDCIIVDDFDTDEQCLNEEVINKKWKWFEEALFFTVDVAEPYLIIWLGNIISEDCCVVRAGLVADHTETINIRDDDGVSIWPQKNAEADIDYQISKVSWSASQKELFNNPYTQGKAFKEVTWGRVPPLHRFPFLVSYADPATSNKDRGKGNSRTSMKAVVLVGLYDGIYYVIKCRVDQMRNADFVDNVFQMEVFVNNKTTVFSYIENNGFQNPFYEQVFVPLFFQKSKEFYRPVTVIPDMRDKPDKYVRIEGTLEPLNRFKTLVFNEKEKDDEDMKRLVAQLKSVSPVSKTMDAPDALEGAVYMINTRNVSVGGIELWDRPENENRF